MVLPCCPFRIDKKNLDIIEHTSKNQPKKSYKNKNVNFRLFNPNKSVLLNSADATPITLKRDSVQSKHKPLTPRGKELIFEAQRDHATAVTNCMIKQSLKTKKL